MRLTFFNYELEITRTINPSFLKVGQEDLFIREMPMAGLEPARV